MMASSFSADLPIIPFSWAMLKHHTLHREIHQSKPITSLYTYVSSILICWMKCSLFGIHSFHNPYVFHYLSCTSMGDSFFVALKNRGIPGKNVAKMLHYKVQLLLSKPHLISERWFRYLKISETLWCYYRKSRFIVLRAWEMMLLPWKNNILACRDDGKIHNSLSRENVWHHKKMSWLKYVNPWPVTASV